MTITEKSVGKGRTLMGRMGWGLVLGVSLILFLLPSRYTPANLSPQTWLAIMIISLLLLWLALLIGVGLLIIRYLDFFRQIWGTLLFLGLFIIALRLFTTLQTLENAGWLLRQLALISSVWAIMLPAAVTIALAVYLWHRDRAVQVTAVTFLVIVWLFVVYTRLRGPEQVLQDAFQGNFPGEFFALICFSQIVFILGPMFFIGHSLRLLYREWTRADMTLPEVQDSQLEDTT